MHSASTTIAETPAHLFRVETRKAGAGVRSKLYKYEKLADGMIAWNVFGGCDWVCAEHTGRATAKAVIDTHAAGVAMARTVVRLQFPEAVEVFA